MASNVEQRVPAISEQMNSFPQAPSMFAPPENLDARRLYAFPRLPEAPRFPVAQEGSFESLIVWYAPADLRNVARFRVYDTETNNLVWESVDNSARKLRLALPANTSKLFLLSSVDPQGRESEKVPIVGTSNADLFDGASGGTSPDPPPEWELIPSGGAILKFELLG